MFCHTLLIIGWKFVFTNLVSTKSFGSKFRTKKQMVIKVNEVLCQCDYKTLGNSAIWDQIIKFPSVRNFFKQQISNIFDVKLFKVI